MFLAENVVMNSVRSSSISVKHIRPSEVVSETLAKFKIFSNFWINLNLNGLSSMSFHTKKWLFTMVSILVAKLKSLAVSPSASWVVSVILSLLYTLSQSGW